MKDYQFHPFAEVFPLMDDDTYLPFREHLRVHGQQEKIARQGEIYLDGRNRLRACREVGIEPQFIDIPMDVDPVQYILAQNLHHRHLTASQRGMIGAHVANLQRGDNQHSIAEGPQNKGPSAEYAARLLGVSTSTIESARKIARAGAECVNVAVMKGSLTIGSATEFIKAVPEKEQQKAILEASKEQTKLAVEVKEEADKELEKKRKDLEVARKKKDKEAERAAKKAADEAAQVARQKQRELERAQRQAARQAAKDAAKAVKEAEKRRQMQELVAADPEKYRELAHKKMISQAIFLMRGIDDYAHHARNRNPHRQLIADIQIFIKRLRGWR